MVVLVCGLSNEALFILYYLYSNLNLSQSAGQNSKKMARDFRKEFGCRNDKIFDKTIQMLKNRGYITAIGKNPVKYYISDKPMTFTALGKHGHPVSPGRKRPL